MRTLKCYGQMAVRSKTNRFAILLAGLSAFQLAIPSFAYSLTPASLAGMGVVVAMVIAYLRSITTTPLRHKVKE